MISRLYEKNVKSNISFLKKQLNILCIKLYENEDKKPIMTKKHPIDWNDLFYSS